MDGQLQGVNLISGVATSRDSNVGVLCNCLLGVSYHKHYTRYLVPGGTWYVIRSSPLCGASYLPRTTNDLLTRPPVVTDRQKIRKIKTAWPPLLRPPPLRSLFFHPSLVSGRRSTIEVQPNISEAPYLTRKRTSAKIEMHSRLIIPWPKSTKRCFSKSRLTFRHLGSRKTPSF